MQITNSNFLFQFHEGPIKTKHSVTLCLTFTRFNSMKVRLNLLDFVQAADQINGFNSMKVRLKLISFASNVIVSRCFNSMKVRLKPEDGSTATGSIVSFNSMKVRLKHGQKRWLTSKTRFQFHEGPIKTSTNNNDRSKPHSVSIP